MHQTFNKTIGAKNTSHLRASWENSNLGGISARRGLKLQICSYFHGILLASSNEGLDLLLPEDHVW